MPNLIKGLPKGKFYPVILFLLLLLLYYKLFLLGKIPFPGDLLVGSYFPWLDYYKVPVQNPTISDVFSQLYLWKSLAIDLIKNGQWPLWNPYSFTGTPLLANYQSAALYPLNILLLLPKNFGWGLFIFSQTLIAAFSMYFLLSIWVKSQLARFCAALVYCLAALMTTWLELGTVGHAMAWLPLSFLLIEQFLKKNKVRFLLLLTVSLSLTILAGHLQVSIYTFVLTFSFVVFRVFTGEKTKLTSQILLLIPFILAMGLTAVQLLPSWELLQKSIRTTDSYIQSNNFGLLPAGDFLKFFSADFFGNPVTGNYWGALNYFETGAFLGSASLVLMIFIILYLKKNSLVKFFLSFLGISLVLLFANPISEFVYQTNLPLLTFSYASRILFVTVFCSAVLIAFALEQILSQPDQYQKLVKCIRYSLAVFIGILLGVGIAQQMVQRIVAHPQVVLNNQYLPNPVVKRVYESDGPRFIQNVHVAWRNSLLPMMILITAFVAAVLVGKLPKVNKSYVLVVVLVGLIIGDLSKYFLKFNGFVDQNYIFPTTPAIEFLKNHQQDYRIGREHAEVLPPNTWMAYGLSSLEGYDPLYFNEYGKFMHYLNGGNPGTGNTGRYAELSSDYTHPFIDAASVKYFIAVLRDDHGYTPGHLVNYQFNEAGYKRVFEDKSTAILENPRVMDRAYLAVQIITVSKDQLYQLMASNQLDPHKTVALIGDLGVQQVDGSGIAKIVNFSPNQVVLSTTSGHDAVLVLADQYDDGWRAFVDGKDTKIVRANLIFRAIKVPSGLHQVVFSYQPASFGLGLKIFFITAVTMILIGGFSYFRKIL